MIKIQEIRQYIDAKKAVRESLYKTSLEIGVRIAAQAKLLAPVQEGQLRNSISASTLKETKLLNDGDGKASAKLDDSGLKHGEAYVGSNTDHTIFVEYGTIKMAAQPFLRPSAELITSGSTVGDIVKKYGLEEMDKELKNRIEEKRTV